MYKITIIIIIIALSYSLTHSLTLLPFPLFFLLSKFWIFHSHQRTLLLFTTLQPLPCPPTERGWVQLVCVFFYCALFLHFHDHGHGHWLSDPCWLVGFQFLFLTFFYFNSFNINHFALQRWHFLRILSLIFVFFYLSSPSVSWKSCIMQISNLSSKSIHCWLFHCFLKCSYMAVSVRRLGNFQFLVRDKAYRPISHKGNWSCLLGISIFWVSHISV